MNETAFVAWFRQAGPYINAHRGKTFVVCMSGAAIQDDERFRELIHDLALLHSLGIRLVLVHGARVQIEQRLREAGCATSYRDGLRITDEAALSYVKEAVGATRIRVEARLSMGLANSPMAGARIRVASGNFVTARPMGVREGIDFGFTGTVRRIDHRALRRWLDGGAVVLLSPLGYSPTGEVFNVNAEEIAAAAAAALSADKFLIVHDGAVLSDEDGTLLRQLSPSDAQQILKREDLTGEARRHLEQALAACRQGVRRVHLLDRHLDGSLLLELFTRDGVGTLISADLYEGLRPASIDDIGGLLELLRPLEAKGVLVRRSRELLEMEIDRFSVLERDGAVIGCAALYPFTEQGEGFGELACLAIHPDYRNSGRAEALLQAIEKQARRQKLRRLFVLTTQTAHWFLERGFEAAQLADLPVQRQAMYNYQRRSKVFVKAIQP